MRHGLVFFCALFCAFVVSCCDARYCAGGGFFPFFRAGGRWGSGWECCLRLTKRRGCAVGSVAVFEGLHLCGVRTRVDSILVSFAREGVLFFSARDSNYRTASVCEVVFE